jgi:phosphoribosylformylglycinamidine synthase
MAISALILHANGTNRDHEAALALSLAGARPEIVHLNELRAGTRRWADYQMLAVPGGFSYADALGAGKLLALDLLAYFADEVSAFVASGKPVIGICNGFQALVKAGILPGGAGLKPQFEHVQPGGMAAGERSLLPDDRRPLWAADNESWSRSGQTVPHPAKRRPSALATLTFNAAGRFECRWVTLLPQSEVCVWTRGLREAIECPVAHGEGNFLVAAPDVLSALQAMGQVALVYAGPQGGPAGGAYPYNPNGSAGDIAGVCNPAGNVLGLMPHPEDHLFAYQHPRWTRGAQGGLGLPLFVNGVKHAEQL